MTKYECLAERACDFGMQIHEKHYLGNDSVPKENYLLGLTCGTHIALAKELETDAQKASVLAEELSHCLLTVGDITDQTNSDNRKQEQRARGFSYDRLFGLDGLAAAIGNGCSNFYEMGEFLEVSEESVRDAVEYYHGKFGISVERPSYILTFEPVLSVKWKEETPM